MKSCFELEIEEKHKEIFDFDKNEIDNPNPYNPARLKYLDRIRTIVFLALKYPNGKVCDVGCAQGNISLTLGELGCDVTAVDINPDYIEYSKMKYEFGNVDWVTGNIEELEFQETFDIVIASELIEHCAYPEIIMKTIFKCLKPGGVVIVTTPNGAKLGSRLMIRLPSLTRLRKMQNRKNIEEKQFGPHGEHHLFQMRLKEMKYVVPQNGEIVKRGYCGGSTLLINKFTAFFLKVISVKTTEKIVKGIARTPLLNKMASSKIYAVIRKTT
jgi:2-polyprenyl-3-methyl-5-hydroxy-6-metoxy-1,4-benzoquinol methylase